MKNKLSEHVELAMGSLNGIKRAEASPFLFGKIMHRMNGAANENNYYHAKAVLRFAMLITLLLCLNAITLKKQRTNSSHQLNEEEQIMGLAQSYFGNDNLYIY